MSAFEEDSFLLAATGGTGHTCDLYEGDDYYAYISCQACGEERRRIEVKEDIKKKVNHIEETSDDIFEIAEVLTPNWRAVCCECKSMSGLSFLSTTSHITGLYTLTGTSIKK